MAQETPRRAALIEAARLARVHPGDDYDIAAANADGAAAYLLNFMRLNGDFSLGLLQAASYLLSGSGHEDFEMQEQVCRMTERALRIAPGNPDVLRRAYTIFERMVPNSMRSRNDIIITDANWETLPEQELLR